MIVDQAPIGSSVTNYDREHLALYLRLLDARADGAPWEEVCVLLLGIDAVTDPQRAQGRYQSHLDRALWMSAQGYLDVMGGDGSKT